MLKLLVQWFSEASIDREGAIKNVHLVGLKSLNGYSYAPSALQDAVPLYENVDVYLGHSRDDEERPPEKKIGIVKSPKYIEGKGVFGDMQLNPKHPFFEAIAWWINKLPAKMGMSHDVNGVMNVRDAIVEKIHKVKSVDIVCSAATTNGMFAESVKQNKDLTSIMEAFNSNAAMILNPLDKQLTEGEKAINLANLAEELRNLLPVKKEKPMEYPDIKLDDLKKHRADLVESIINENKDAIVKTALDAERSIVANVSEALKALDSKLISETFRKLIEAEIRAGHDVKALIDDRKALAIVESAAPAGAQKKEEKKTAITDESLLAALG